MMTGHIWRSPLRGLQMLVITSVVWAHSLVPSVAVADVVTVDGGPRARIVSVRWTPHPRAGQRVTIRLAARDPDATVTEWEIDWGDDYGSHATNDCDPAIVGTDPQPGAIVRVRVSHRYERPGRYTVRVRPSSRLCDAMSDMQSGLITRRHLRVYRRTR